MTGFDPAAFPMARKGRQYQDFTVGQVLEHHWGRTITAGDNALFTTAMCNWNPMHLNAEFARAHGHPDVVVNPMLVLCTAVGLSVGSWQSIPRASIHWNVGFSTASLTSSFCDSKTWPKSSNRHQFCSG